MDQRNNDLESDSALFKRPTSQCQDGGGEDVLTTGLVVVLVVLGVLLVLCLALVIFYHRRKAPLNRVRSKVYSRLYSKDRYGRPISKTAFMDKVAEMLNEESGGESGGSSALKSEFDELERISFDTIQRKASSALANRRRNRYNDIIPFDANRVILKEKIKLDKVSLSNNTQ